MKYDDICDTLKVKLKEALGWVNDVVDDDATWHDSVQAPIVTLEHVDSDADGQQNGTQQITVNMRWNARLVCDSDADDARQQSRRGGIALMLALKKIGSLGKDCGAIMVLREAEDEFRAPLNGYVVRVVEFEFIASLGSMDGLLDSEAQNEQALEMQAWLRGVVPAVRIGHTDCKKEVHSDVPMTEVKE